MSIFTESITENKRVNALYFSIFPEEIMHNHTFRLKRFVREMVKEADRPGKKVLDVGAGSCPYRSWFKQAHYTAQDIKNNRRHSVDLVCDAKKIPVADGSFDYILCIQVLEHVREPHLVFAEFCRILKPGGKVFLTTHLAFEEHMVPFDYFRFTQYGLRFLAESGGFRVGRIEPQGGRFIVLLKELQVLVPRLLRGKSAVFMFYLIFSIPLFFLSLILFWLDSLDREPTLTLGYECVLVK